MSSKCIMEHQKLFDQLHCFLACPKLWVQALLKVPSNVQQNFSNHSGRFWRKKLVICNPHSTFHNTAVLNFWIHTVKDCNYHVKINWIFNTTVLIIGVLVYSFILVKSALCTLDNSDITLKILIASIPPHMSTLQKQQMHSYNKSNL